MIKFENTTSRSATEQEELFKALVEKAINKEHTGFEYIKNVVEFRVMRSSRKGLRTVIKLFDHILDSMYKAYCKQVRDGNNDFSLLCAYRQYGECREFYKKELETAENMLDEYDAYLGKGHFMDQFFWGKERESWHCWDHRNEGP